MKKYLYLGTILIVCMALYFLYRKSQKTIERFVETPPDLADTIKAITNEIDNDIDLNETLNTKVDESTIESESNAETKENMETQNSATIQSVPTNITYTQVDMSDYIHKNNVPNLHFF